MSALAYAPDERRPPVAAYTAGDGFITHWAGYRLDLSGAQATLNEHLLRANAVHLDAEKRATARQLADQLTAAMRAAFPLKES